MFLLACYAAGSCRMSRYDGLLDEDQFLADVNLEDLESTSDPVKDKNTGYRRWSRYAQRGKLDYSWCYRMQ